MYAVIKTGGKQYRVASGALDHVLMLGDGENVTMGTPLVAGATVKATVVAHGRGEKLKIFKMRRRKHFRKTLGHRQNYTEIQISGISA